MSLIKRLVILSLALGLGLSVVSCDSDDDKKSVSSEQIKTDNSGNSQGNNNSGKQTANSSEKADSEQPQNNGQRGEEPVKPGHDGEHEATHSSCDSACSEGYSCVGGKCIKNDEITTKCGEMICADGQACVDDMCIHIENTDDTDICEPACDAGQMCVKGKCVDKTNEDIGNCDVNPCDPSAVCVSSHYCLEACASGAKEIESLNEIARIVSFTGIDMAKSGITVIKSKAELEALVAENEISEFNPEKVDVDFSAHWILAITSGWKSNTGFSMSLVSACVSGDKTTVKMSVENCETDAAGDALTWLWNFYEVPAQGEYVAEFVEAHNVGCSGN